MQDDKIIELYWQRDECALKETQNKYGRYLFKIAYNILSDREETEEAVNDAYLAAWNTIPPQNPSELSLYLAKLVRRISIDKLRKSNRQKRVPSEYSVSIDELGADLSCGNSTEEEFELNRLVNALNEFVGALDERERNIFLGRYYFHDSVKEISRYVGVKESNLKTILSRTRQKLKNYLKSEGFDV